MHRDEGGLCNGDQLAIIERIDWTCSCPLTALAVRMKLAVDYSCLRYWQPLLLSAEAASDFPSAAAVDVAAVSAAPVVETADGTASLVDTLDFGHRTPG
jgi:hypothetical protein